MRIQGVVEQLDRGLDGHVDAMTKADPEDGQISPHGHSEAVGLLGRGKRALELITRKQAVLVGRIPAEIHR
jgi:hypothetical protein